MNHEALLDTRAELNGCEPVHCQSCGEPLVFAMKDAEAEFSLGLLTVLRCIALAEDEGCLPDIPFGWWLQIEQRYELNVRV